MAEYEALYFVALPQGYASAWTPPVTPAGRPMRLRRMNAHYVEETIRMAVEDGVAHLTFVSLLDRYRIPGVVVIPVVGLPPMTAAAMWSGTTLRHRLAPAFAQVALDHSIEAGWPRTARS